MGAVRTSDLAVASAAGAALWLLVRTALRGPVIASVIAVGVGWFAALVLRSKREREAVTIPMYAFAVALCLARALEFCWDLVRARALAAGAVCALIAAGGWIAARRPRLGATVAIAGLALGVATREASAAWSMLFCVWLARVVGRAWAASEARAWARKALWASALIAAVWAMRGATIGPFALMVGAGREASGLWTSEARDEGAREDVLVFALAIAGMTASRAWEQCPLLFV
jgi:hypothetical protein